MRRLRSLVIIRFLMIFVPAFLAGTTVLLDHLAERRLAKAESALASRMGSAAGQVIAALNRETITSNPGRIRERLAVLSADPSITCIEIFVDTTLDKSVSYPRNIGCSPMHPQRTIRLQAPADQGIFVQIGYSLDELTRLRKETTLGTIITVSLALAIATLLAFAAFYRSVSRPLGLLRDAISRIDSARDFVPVPVGANDEIGEICSAFNRMQADLGEERSRVIMALERVDRLYNQTPALLFLIDAEGRITGISDFWAAETRYTREEVTGKPLGGLLDAESARVLDACLSGDLKAGRGIRDVPLRMKCRDGRTIDVLLAATAVPGHNATDGAPEYLCVMSDVSQLRSAQERLDVLANTDSLTSLPNRHGLARIMNEMRERILSRKADDCGCTVMFIDLDNFKTVNDTLGHAAGDHVLKTASRRITSIIGDSGIVARIGGDELAVVCPDMLEPEKAGRLAGRLIESISRPIEFEEQAAHIGASIGISTCADASHQPDQALRQADQAMYLAKNEGKNRYAFYDRSLAARVAAKARGVQMVQEGLAKGWFEMHFQPIVDLASLRPRGVEALFRFTQPMEGVTSIEDFIRAAEESGQMGKLGSWILNRAVSQFLEIIAPQAGGDIYLTINLSPAQLSPAFVDSAEKLMIDHPDLRGRVVFEVTETAAIRHFDETVLMLGRLKSVGAMIAIDDFGTGHSSLSYLARLPIDIIKLDRVFTQSVRHSGDEDGTPCKQLALVKTMVTLSDALDVGLVAEGVEDADDIRTLSDAGIRTGQGWAFAPALDAGSVAQWLSAHAPASRPNAKRRVPAARLRSAIERA